LQAPEVGQHRLGAAESEVPESASSLQTGDQLGLRRGRARALEHGRHLRCAPDCTEGRELVVCSTQVEAAPGDVACSLSRPAQADARHRGFERCVEFAPARHGGVRSVDGRQILSRQQFLAGGRQRGGGAEARARVSVGDASEACRGGGGCVGVVACFGDLGLCVQQGNQLQFAERRTLFPRQCRRVVDRVGDQFRRGRQVALLQP
jgi:hypothetical protein